MYSGWFIPFLVNRPVTLQEHTEVLPRDLKRLADVETDERGCVLHLNSTYMDMIDRWFWLRGGFESIVKLTGIAMLLGMFLFYLFFAFIPSYMGGKLDFATEIGLCSTFGLGVVGPIVFGRRMIQGEFFSYTHYPIRFNRQTQMVHVFRRKGLGGILSVPWDQVYFHMGHGRVDKYIIDVRGHVIEDELVQDTFAVGHCFGMDDPRPIRQIWKFIVTYMDQGPQALPNDIDIMMSTGTDFKNCLLWSISYCEIMLPIPLVMWVFVALVVAMRWTVMQTCKVPVWPEAIEAESVIAVDDPHRWPEPSYTAEFAKDDKVWAAALARKRRRG